MKSRSYANSIKTFSPHPLAVLKQSTLRNTHDSYVLTRTRLHLRGLPYGPSWSCQAYCCRSHTGSKEFSKHLLRHLAMWKADRIKELKQLVSGWLLWPLVPFHHNWLWLTARSLCNSAFGFALGCSTLSLSVLYTSGVSLWAPPCCILWSKRWCHVCSTCKQVQWSNNLTCMMSYNKLCLS